jgi:amino acid adenylation domain-containing protein
MDTLASRLAELTPQQKRELLTRAAEFDLFPLSHGQERMWFLDRLRPGTPNYNMPGRVDFRGRLDVPALERALQAVAERHESLRTAFVEFEGVPMQLVQPPKHRLERIDLGASPADVREAECERLLLAAAREPFDLAEGHLFRSVLVRLDDEHHVLLLNLHHIVCDDWSHGVLMREIAAGYTGGELPPLEIQYADYACWQREQQQGEDTEHLATYWKQRLDGAPGLLAMPLDRARPPVQNFNGARIEFALDADLSQRIERLARERNATPYMVVFAAFQVLLHRYTGQQDMVIATPIANRPSPELEALVGLFFNTLPMRADCAGDPEFATLLERVRDAALQDYAHQDMPFVKIVELLQPERALSHNPLVQAMFILQNAPHEAFELPGLSARMREVDNRTAQFDLILSLRRTADGMAGYVHYDTDIFEAATMQRLIGHYRTLLQSACADPSRRISLLPMLTPAELHRVRYDWNDTDRPREAGVCLHHLVQRQVAAAPDATAVIFGDDTLTYGALDARANQLAHALLALGAKPGSNIGLCLRPGPDMVIALLATVKTGCAYVPLDPAYPAERIAFMLRDAGIAALISADPVASQLPAVDCPLLLLDADTAREQSTDAPQVNVTGEHLAYVIYTSGTTGRPKGVMIRHAGIVNNLLDLNESHGVGATDRVLALSSFSFDMFVYETFGILAAGGAVVMPEADGARDPAHWAELIQRHRVTIWNSAPALLEMLLRHVESVPGLTLPSLRTAIMGGDWVPVTMPDRFKRMAPGARYDVLGGATEASIHSITETVHRVDPEWTSIPYGKPMVNQRALVLDAELNPVPVGVPGELYLGGKGLGHGYWARPSLTAERFLPDPHTDVPGARMYRTGDLARWREDGTIILIGRIDHQVKIRGHRIELGEIESALREHPAVRQAVAGARPDATGEKRLVAWIVFHEGQAVPLDQVLDVARAHLPAYMVPAVAMALQKLPLSPNGKVDRSAMPAPDAAPSNVVRELPQTPLQALVADLFGEVLGLDAVGLHDNFFDLGGHSLRATQLAALVREWFQIELPLRQLLLEPTVAAVADELQKLAAERSVDLDALLAEMEAGEGVTEEEMA